MVNTRLEVTSGLLCTITLLGFVGCQFNACSPQAGTVYLSEDDCHYFCPVAPLINAYLLCKEDGHTVVKCSSSAQKDEPRTELCMDIRCEIGTSSCQQTQSFVIRKVRFVRSQTPNVTVGPIYIYPENPIRPISTGDLPRITFEEPSSQTYMYGILSFFFGVIAFFVFALVFRFLYKRYQRHPIHVHTFSGHQLPLGSLQLRSFLSPSPYPPQMTFPHNEQAGIPGLDLPPSYVVASELLDPPPSYDDISKPKRNSAQMKVTSL